MLFIFSPRENTIIIRCFFFINWIKYQKRSITKVEIVDWLIDNISKKNISKNRQIVFFGNVCNVVFICVFIWMEFLIYHNKMEFEPIGRYLSKWSSIMIDFNENDICFFSLLKKNLVIKIFVSSIRYNNRSIMSTTVNNMNFFSFFNSHHFLLFKIYIYFIYNKKNKINQLLSIYIQWELINKSNSILEKKIDRKDI